MRILDSICPRFNRTLLKINGVEKDRLSGSTHRVSDSHGGRVKKSHVDRNRSRGNDNYPTSSGWANNPYKENLYHDDECPLVRDYGPRKYGMSQSTWTLMILSRRCAGQVKMMS